MGNKKPRRSGTSSGRDALAGQMPGVEADAVRRADDRLCERERRGSPARRILHCLNAQSCILLTGTTEPCILNRITCTVWSSWAMLPGPDTTPSWNFPTGTRAIVSERIDCRQNTEQQGGTAARWMRSVRRVDRKQDQAAVSDSALAFCWRRRAITRRPATRPSPLSSSMEPGSGTVMPAGSPFRRRKPPPARKNGSA